ncbi:hypothetical protein [Acinetobacter ursingii]|mgnify:FL=1|uniref:Uncharacterized protein n=1 Tax=Acinetobacter ursingii TaxID=108980 RepID=A0AA46P4A1_9GAMM|nr:hypothetical protein [Acinetobacter ursingii]MDH2019261.1 hypothetical protein [Acinetobacter ursingii]MDH2071678.1 hypothetical protein [Acinetobacter ursingii]MEC8055628.1 hypothetical protein [Pseudomonadota bacterium]UYF75291.1 hypothetical protein LSO58_16120 [Acinetobacter ursingii]
MRDSIHKKQIIQSIRHLQLSESLVIALDDAQQATDIMVMLDSLQRFSEQWH